MEKTLDWLHDDIEKIQNSLHDIYNRIEELQKDFSDYKLDAEKECNDRHKPIDEKLTVITTKNMTVGAMIMILVSIIGQLAIGWLLKHV